MTERWKEIKSIVGLALEAPATERQALVDSACGADSELRREVESLLVAADSADTVPEVRAAIASATAAFITEDDAALRNVLENVLGHQYEIIRPLGSGGMGCVYLARERALERLVAIKVLRPDLAIAEGHRERFRREARIVAQLTHPGILGLHSFGEINGLWYFVMTYVRGETLADRIRREGLLPWAEAHRIMVEMADALVCAHRNGVVHRDIKPANILLDRESGHAVLADFGISKVHGAAKSLTASGAMIGTPDYMSPEQAMGAADIDERSDLYSLGAVAYVMLTGREPFRGATAAATIYRRLVDDAPDVTTFVSSIPPDLSAVVRKCMARDKTERWADARSLKEALENILAVDHLPDVVRDLPSFGPYALLWVAAWIGLAVFKGRSPSEMTLMIVIALIVPTGLVVHLWNGAGRGMRFIELARVALWPPEWWGLWWPRSLRRPSDLWDRLPIVAKSVRVLLIALCPALLVLVLMRGRVAGARGALFEAWVGVGEWTIFIGGALAVAAALAWARSKGLSLDQSLRFLIGPSLASSGWNEPELNRLLLSSHAGIRSPEGDAPSDYLRAIREIVPLLRSNGENSGARTAAAADCVLKAIDQRDRELESLSRSASPSEANRLESQLDSLDPNADDTGERAELRVLVQHQLDIVRRMQGRREVVLGERARLFGMLRSLWTLARAVSVGKPEDPEEIQKLGTLCTDIGVELDDVHLSGRKAFSD